MRPLLLAALAVSAATLPGCSVESSTFYFPSRDAFLTPPGVENVEIPAASGMTLHAWFLPAADARPGEARPAILHVHGNAGNVSMHAAFSEFLTRHGFHVLVFDYRSFGRSSPGPDPLIRADLLADARAAFASLRSRPDVIPDRIGVFGMSLGGVIGLALAADEPEIRCVVSVAAFDRWKGIAAHHVPVLGGMLIPSGLDAVDSAAKLGSRPLLIVHGDRDTTVPPSCAERIAEAAARAGVPVSRLDLPAGHNDILLDDERAQGLVAGFYAATLDPQRSAARP